MLWIFLLLIDVSKKWALKKTSRDLTIAKNAGITNLDCKCQKRQIPEAIFIYSQICEFYLVSEHWCRQGTVDLCVFVLWLNFFFDSKEECGTYLLVFSLVFEFHTEGWPQAKHKIRWRHSQNISKKGNQANSFFPPMHRFINELSATEKGRVSNCQLWKYS